MTTKQRLTVKWWNDAKGYGILTNPTHNQIFAHYTGIVGEGFKTLSENQVVYADLVDGPKGPMAVGIEKTQEFEPAPATAEEWEHA